MQSISITPKELETISLSSQDQEQIGQNLGRTYTILNSKKPMQDMIPVRKYPVNINSDITDLFKLSSSELLEIIQAVNEAYQKIEKSEHPGAGYEVHFKVIAKGKRPVEVILEAHGEREVGSKIAMPMPKVQDEKSCAFCQNKESMIGYEDAKTESAHVIKSLEGNPLVISSNKHPIHFFDQDVKGQRDMLASAIKVVQIYTQEKCSRFTLSSHVGIEGHQTFPHAHIHGLGSFFQK